MSEHEVKVIKVDKIEPHNNADALEIINIWGYTCVVGKGQFKVGDLVAFIEPDYCVDITRPEFSFIRSSKQIHRMTTRRFRGVWSYGLLIPAPKGSIEGENVMERLGVVRWEPQVTIKNNPKTGIPTKGPEIQAPKYTLENIRKYNKLITSADEVCYTAKLHGCNGRMVYSDGQMFCGSHNVWRKRPGYYFTSPKLKYLAFTLMLLKFVSKCNAEKAFGLLSWYKSLRTRLVYYHDGDMWWSAYEQNPWIGEWCKKNPNVVLYGELVGPTVQGEKFHYGYIDEQIGFYVFDILENGRWLSISEFVNERFSGLKFVPIVYSGPFDQEKLEQLAEQKETFNNANHVREGLVVKLREERIDSKIGRVALKYVSNNYFEKS